ncbi:alpha/beta family hydrolase [Pseudonocardia spinosispora]|uniref:alpha/beta hydrolase family protein n=1 Tax=Pseudonocardia spinosispora TaxID=103441 RepID=UPI0003F4E36B|nr:alpha/beta family hydrolase [Pseudonocardia spinosispora]
MTTHEVDTPHGTARVAVHCAPEGRAALLLGHGAGGGVTAPDLVAAAQAAKRAGVHVALVEQPYRVAGRRAPAPATQLDAAWLTVAEYLGKSVFDGLPTVFGGRSSGARVACRTAEEGDAAAVLCLAFPVHPPGKPEKDRLPELSAVQVPVLVVQGENDPFGKPAPGQHRDVVMLPGNHSLNSDLNALARTVTEWLERVLRVI